MDENTKNILDSLEFIKEKMAIKGELSDGLSGFRADMNQGFTAVDTRLENIEERLKDLPALRVDILKMQQQLEILSETVNGMKGYATEIDELRSRVNAMELKLEKALA